jgi:hypothetical protein
MESKLFESIYSENYSTEALAKEIYLESPLDTETKPPLNMKEAQYDENVFQKIYEACRDNND